jgi:predicted DNA-binding transcriptional regulator AlpA
MSKSKLKPKLSTVATAAADSRMSVRLLSRAEVLEIIGVSYPTLWFWVKKGHFPAPRVLGLKTTDGNKGGRICWVESEIQDWIMALPKRLPDLTEVA